MVAGVVLMAALCAAAGDGGRAGGRECGSGPADSAAVRTASVGERFRPLPPRFAAGAAAIPLSPHPALPPSASSARALLRADTPLVAPTRYHEADAWLGNDKLKHFLMSFAVTGFGYAGARTVRLGHDPALVAAAGGGVIAGIGKEVHDRLSGGDVSARDLAWDAAGIVLGIVLAGHSR